MNAYIYPLAGLIIALMIVVILSSSDSASKEKSAARPTYPHIRGYAAYNNGRPGDYSHVIVEYPGNRVEAVTVERAKAEHLPFFNPSWTWDNLPAGDDVTSRHGEQEDPRKSQTTYEVW